MLQRVRVRAGLTQAELAARAGTSQATVCAYERGTKEPGAATLARLVEAAGARLVAEPVRAAAPPPRRVLADRGRRLVDVLGLAEALPARHERRLRYPRLP